MKVVGYIRVSTEEQASDGVSLDAQRAKVEGYARLYDLTLVDIVVDAGQSAKTLDRPGLARALALLDAGRAAGLLVAKLDRLTRSVADAIDTRTAAGRLVLNVLMSVAQWERETIVERTRDAMRHKKGRAERVGQVPYGHDLAADGRTLVPNDREQHVLAEIRVRRDRGHSLRRIAAELTRIGVPTKTGNARWSHSSIADILKGARHAQDHTQDRPEPDAPGRGPARAE
jgi:site-specific DNA recombinase